MPLEPTGNRVTHCVRSYPVTKGKCRKTGNDPHGKTQTASGLLLMTCMKGAAFANSWKMGVGCSSCLTAFQSQQIKVGKLSCGTWQPHPRCLLPDPTPGNIRKEPGQWAHPRPFGSMCPSMKSTLAFLSLRLMLLTCG